MRISDWSSDVCSSDLLDARGDEFVAEMVGGCEVLGCANFLAAREEGFDCVFGDGRRFRTNPEVETGKPKQIQPQTPVQLHQSPHLVGRCASFQLCDFFDDC